MKVGVLYSGGKDSNLVVHRARERGSRVECLISIIPRSADSYMFHHPNVHLTELQAESIGLPLLRTWTEGEKEKELEDLERILRRAKRNLRIEGVFSGALASNYQRSRIEKVCGDVGLDCFTPLWGHDPRSLLKEMLELGFETIITSVSAEGFDESWLGRKIDGECLKDLERLREKHRIHMAFEGGEAETFVVDGPTFSKRIEILKTKKTWTGYSGVLEIEEARLVDKAAAH